MASPNLSQIVATTLRDRSSVIADNVSNNNALLARLKKRGNVRPFSGGTAITEIIEYAENQTYLRYSGYDLLNISPSDVITAADFDIKQVAIAISMSGLEELQNAGPAQVIDLLEAKVKNAERSAANGLAADIYSDGTADDGKQIGGLDLLVPTDPTVGTVGGIDRSVWPFYRSVKFDISVDGSGPATSANIQSYMNRVATQLQRGADSADIIVADSNFYGLYLESLTSIQRIASAEVAGSGFSTLTYNAYGGRSDVVLDGGIGGNAATDTMFFLNSDFLSLRPHADRNMVPLGEDRQPVNQDATVKLMGWAGNMTMNGAQFHGRLFA